MKYSVIELAATGAPYVAAELNVLAADGWEIVAVFDNPYHRRLCALVRRADAAA